jgi:hypothetical protein
MGYSAGMDVIPITYNNPGENWKRSEGYVKVNFMPIIDENGKIAGIYQHNHYVTTRILADRRYANDLRRQSSLNSVGLLLSVTCA